MTALIFSLKPEQVVVAMDTLSAYEKDGEEVPFLFTSKMYPIPHLNGLICGTGIGNLVAEWFIRSKDCVVEDLIHINQFAPENLQELDKRHQLSTDSTTTIYHFCWDKYENRYRGYAFRSANGFVVEELQYGIGTKPGIEIAELTHYPDSFVELMKIQRENDNKKPVEERVFIGGEIQLAVMEKGLGVSLFTVYRFEDYEQQYQTMCANLPADVRQLVNSDNH